MKEDSQNYFTAIEDHFRATRGTPTFILSPLDWALIETWRDAGIPLKIVLRGIDLAFQRWRLPGRARTSMVNSLAYCTNAIAEEAQAMVPVARKNAEPPFSLDRVQAFVSRNAAALRQAHQFDLASSLESMDLASSYRDLERLEQHLTVIEEEMITRLRDAATEKTLLEAHHALDRELKPYRGKMTAEQLAMLERQFLDRHLLESAGLPRLSLFYL